MAGYLATRGPIILANGYNITLIVPGTKHPATKRWSKTNADAKQLQRWLENKADYGIGIITGNVSFVDIDIPDREMGHINKKTKIVTWYVDDQAL